MFDSNAASDKSFKFKVGRGKVIKVIKERNYLNFKLIAMPSRGGTKGPLACAKVEKGCW